MPRHTAIAATICICFISLFSCVKTDTPLTYGSGEYEIRIEPGPEWHHTFYALGFIPVENEPQMAIWLEDTCGNFLRTVYVTSRSGTQGWRMAGGSRRPEALPVWSHRRGIMAADSIYMPTEDNPDASSGATPGGAFSAKFAKEQAPVIICAEINHSADFNDYYPADAVAGTPSYSGGKEGSGQPALVYSAPMTRADSFPDGITLKLAGHSSPDGTDGILRRNLDSITTARDIISAIVIRRAK